MFIYQSALYLIERRHSLLKIGNLLKLLALLVLVENATATWIRRHNFYFYFWNLINHSLNWKRLNYLKQFFFFLVKSLSGKATFIILDLWIITKSKISSVILTLCITKKLINLTFNEQCFFFINFLSFQYNFNSRQIQFFQFNFNFLNK